MAGRRFYARHGFTPLPADPLLWSRPADPPLTFPPHVTRVECPDRNAK